MALQSIDQWDEDVRVRYDPDRKQDHFRDYSDGVAPVVRDFYRANHTNQTVAFVEAKHRQWLGLDYAKSGIWNMMERLNTLVDDSDPDTDLSQIEHNLQTAEAIRAAGYPPWFQLTGLIHDLGKVLWLWGEPQWAVVGDTFPVGCAFSDKIVFPEFFADNPDSQIPPYQTLYGIYEPNCGLDNLKMSWGHDEYLYQWAIKNQTSLPPMALKVMRFHSFYAWHNKGAYQRLLKPEDEETLVWVKRFSASDLYSKADELPTKEYIESTLRPYYGKLIEKYFPREILDW